MYDYERKEEVSPHTESCYSDIIFTVTRMVSTSFEHVPSTTYYVANELHAIMAGLGF